MYDAMAAAQKNLADQAKNTTADVRTQTAALGEWADALQAAGQSVPAMTVSNPLADLAAGVKGNSSGILDEFDAFIAANEKLAGSIGQVRDRLAEQVEYWGMDADAVELAKLAKEGASQQELDELATLQGRLKELQAQKESANVKAAVPTDVTIGARAWGGADLFDAMARRRDAAANAKGGAMSAQDAKQAFAGVDVNQLAKQQPELLTPEAKAAAEAEKALKASAPIAGGWQPLPPAPDVQPIAAPIAGGWQPLPPAPDVQPIAAPIAGGWQPLPPAPDVQPIAAPIAGGWQPLPPAPDVQPIGGAWKPEFRAAARSPQPVAADGKSEQIPWLEKIARGIEALVAKEGLVVEEMRA
jgi:hypothetical protein